MAAYIFADINVTDPQAYEAYRREAPALIAAHGGKYLVRGGEVTVLEGDASPNRKVILEFPTMEQAKAFYYSPQYQAIKAIRQSASTGNLIAIEGWSGV